MGALGNWLIQSPAGLVTGLAALAVPLVIHLISRSRGRRVLIGNISLVRSARRKLVHELKLTQMLLLILRVALVAVAALILAGLAVPGMDRQDGDVIYLTPEWLQVSGSEALSTLEQDEIATFLLTPGFPALKDFKQAAAEEYDLWPLLAERLSSVHHDGEVHVYTAGRLKEFGALRPPLPRPVTWHTATPVSAQAAAIPVKAILIHPQPPDARTLAVDQALQLIKRHRLPELEWQLQANPDSELLNNQDAVIWAVPGSEPGALETGSSRWIDLNTTTWHLAWLAADFPERLTDALLSPDLQRTRWANGSVLPAPTAEQSVRTIRPDQLPVQPLQPWLGLLLVMLWGLERWLSERSGHAEI